MDVQVFINQMLEKIDRLETQFNLYFSGQLKRPPLPLLQQIKSEIMNAMGQIKDLKQQKDKFLLQSLIQKFTTYRMKWERGVKDIEEGRLKPGLHFFGGLGVKLRQELEQEKSETVKERKVDKALSNAAEVDNAVDKYIALSQRFLKKNYNKDAVRQSLEQKLDTVKKKYGNNFKFNVFFDGEKVRIKPEKKEE